MESLFLIVLIAVFGIVRAQPDLQVRFLQPNVEAALQGQLRIICQINITVLQLINDFDVEIVRRVTNNSEIVLSSGARKVAAEAEFYSVMIGETPGFGVKIKFEFLKVRVLDEGQYLCRAKSNSNNTVLEEDSMDIVVLKPVANIHLRFGKSDPISKSLVDPAEVDSGNYPVVCTAEGSNPAATLHLYLDGKPIQKISTQTNKIVSQLIQFRTVVTGNVCIIISNSVRTIECVAEAQVGNNLSVKFPLKTKVYDPDISCDETEAYLGQKDPVLTCIVDYEGLRIKSFRFELAGKDSGKTSAVFEEVSKEALSSTKTRVQLKLKIAEDWLFETEFYMVVEHENGHITRQTVSVHKVPGFTEQGATRGFTEQGATRGSGDNPLISSQALVIFLTFFMWLL